MNKKLVNIADFKATFSLILIFKLIIICYIINSNKNDKIEYLEQRIEKLEYRQFKNLIKEKNCD